MKRELSMLDKQLLDEYFRGEKHIKVNQDILDGCPKGYLSHKKIRGRDCCYLQWREGKKIRSQFVKREDIENLEHKIKVRQKAEHSIRMIRRDMEKIERLLGREVIDEYRDKKNLKERTTNGKIIVSELPHGYGLKIKNGRYFITDSYGEYRLCDYNTLNSAYIMDIAATYIGNIERKKRMRQWKAKT